MLWTLACLFFFAPLHAQQSDNDTTGRQPYIYNEDSTQSAAPAATYFQEKPALVKVADSIRARPIPDSVLNKIKDDDDFWYIHSKKEKQKEQKKEIIYTSHATSGNQWLRIFTWVLIIGGFVGFIYWYLTGMNVSLFRKKVLKSGKKGDEGETERDIFSIHYDDEIHKAERAGNYRVAVRLQFLRLLKRMADKELIRYKQEKTNLDYLTELQASNHYNDFFRVTRYYEYTWYGQFDVNEEAYTVIKKQFDNLTSALQ